METKCITRFHQTKFKHDNFTNSVKLSVHTCLQSRLQFFPSWVNILRFVKRNLMQIDFKIYMKKREFLLVAIRVKLGLIV